ncbi:hypothetical protein BAMA_04085 [Bacillus manliponensis]|uniref:Uncharacterized protein n=1 Tax=Bacillus manliponensis TaxID=574376 RepID=A0A073K8T0_9BACI|nr:hypothetical protein [Bacillus manliponensis]KEK18693.1 hypothetical protein BAMA_04085 [Bacillus manliponensis]
MTDTKTIKPIILTMVLLIAALLVFFIPRLFPGTSLWVGIILFFIIDVGFIVAFVLGMKSKQRSVKVFSIIINGLLFIFLSAIIYLLLLVNSIAES